jgi:hypothetical protein
MLLPGVVRAGLVSCSGPLLLCTSPSPYNGGAGSKNSSPSQLGLSRRHHASNNGLRIARACFHQSWTTKLQCSASRANSSLARAKAAQTKGRTPHQPVSKLPKASVTTGEGDSPKPILSILSRLSPQAIELKSLAEIRLGKFETDNYKAVNQHSDVLWLTWDEFKQVPLNSYTRRPHGSHNSLPYGISRRATSIPLVAGSISNRESRQRIIRWEQDASKDFAPSFKKMLIYRANIARLAGCKSYFEYMSQSKMVGSRYVKHFLDGLGSQIEPLRSALVERLVEEKMRDLNYDYTTKDLHQKLQPGKTIRDYQLYNPDSQIDWGDFCCKLISCLILTYQVITNVARFQYYVVSHQ